MGCANGVLTKQPSGGNGKSIADAPFDSKTGSHGTDNAQTVMIHYQKHNGSTSGASEQTYTSPATSTKTSNTSSKPSSTSTMASKTNGVSNGGNRLDSKNESAAQSTHRMRDRADSNRVRLAETTKTLGPMRDPAADRNSAVMRAILPDARLGDLLMKVPLLRNLSESERDKLGGVMLEQSFTDGEAVFEQGAAGDRFYVILSGTANVVHNGNIVASLHTGDYFGEAALLKDSPRGASIICEGSLEVLYLEKAMFDELLGNARLKVQFLERREAVSAETRFRVQRTPGLMRGRSQYLNLKGQKPDGPSSKSPGGLEQLLEEEEEYEEDIEKTAETRQFLYDALKTCVLTSELEDNYIEQVVEAMTYAIVAPNTVVIQAGDLGENFYVVQTGQLHSMYKEKKITQDGKEVEGNVETKNIGPSEVFGELALMYNTPREITVVSETKCILWLLDRFAFRRLAKNVGEQALKMRRKFLDEVELLQPLTSTERHRVADALEEIVVPPNTTLFKQGDLGDSMYIVSSGHVLVSKRDLSDNGGRKMSVIVNQINYGDYFGERALLKDEPRAASIHTGSKSTHLLKLDRTAFKLLLGPLSNLMEKRAVGYELTNEVDMKLNEDASTSKIKFEDLVPISILGKGSYGVVQLVQDQKTDQVYALKKVSKDHVVATSQQGHIMNEKEAMLTIKHPFLVRLFATYKSREYLYFLLEPVMGGELFTYLRRQQHFPPRIARFYSASVVLGFEYMHRKGMVYRDLKPENLLLSQDGYIKITDFGFAKKINDSSTWTLCGTPEYLAPEIVSGKGHGLAVDWWTLGILIFEMLASHSPFRHEKRMKMYQNIVRGKLMFPSHFSNSARQLLSGLLERKPSQRLGMIHGGAQAVKDHKWYAGFDWKAMALRKYKAPFLPEIKNTVTAKNAPEPLENPTNINDFVQNETDWDADF